MPAHREFSQPVPQDQDQPDDRRVRDLGVPDVGTRDPEDGV